MPTLSVLLALFGVSHATTVFVPTDFATVGDAVANLSAGGTHTINIVQDGDYGDLATIDIGNMNLTVTGTGSGNTVLRVEDFNATSVLKVDGGSLTLNDLTVTGEITGAGVSGSLTGSVCLWPFDGDGGAPTTFDRTAILAVNSDLTLNDVEVRCAFNAAGGAGITADNSNVDIYGSHFEQNVSLGSGGHLLANGNIIAPPTLTVSNSTFEFGGSAGGGGAISAGNVIPSVTQNEFYYNSAVSRGGAVEISTTQGTVEVYENYFQGNIAYALLSYSLTGTGFAQDTSFLITGGVDFSLITGDGGGVFIEADVVDVWANVFCGNMADTGGGVHLDNPQAATVQNNVFNDNYTVHYGAGLYTSQEAAGLPDPVVYNNTFTFNRAGRTLPPSSQVIVLGAGSAAMFDGTVPDFRNNIISTHIEGGGVVGIHGANYQVGDPLTMEYNLWFDNYEAGFYGEQDLMGDFAQHTLNQRNVFFSDPFPTSLGIDDQDCYPDAFYPQWGSPAIDQGDDTDIGFNDPDGTRNDIGFTGGSRSPFEDRDGDGYLQTHDCNDLDAAVNPGAVEDCDLTDNDCDGEVDEGWDSIWYQDTDGDGYGSGVSEPTCAAPGPDWVALGGDCDETDPLINPGAGETCDGKDNDCNDIIDDEDVLTFADYYPDEDGDGYGALSYPLIACTDPGPPYVNNTGDCDDNNTGVFPDSVELCDLLDNDCDGVIDNGAQDATEWYKDADEDGFGSGEPIVACNAPSDGFASQGGDCDESDPAINPQAVEICDDIDQNCDGDPVAGAADATTYYSDADGDGFVDPASGVTACEPVEGLVEVDSSLADPFDCDDSDEFVGPCTASGCDCTSAPGKESTLWLVLGGLLLAARRRRS